MWRTSWLSLQNPTDKAASQMEALGVSVYDSEGNMRSLNDILGDLNASMEGMTSQEKANIISQIFNKTDLSAVNALLGNTGDTWDELQQSIVNSGGAAQQMADTQLDNLSGQLTLLKSALEGLAISFGEILMPMVRSAVEKIQAFVDKLNGMSDAQKETILKSAALAAAIGPLLIVLGKTISTVGTTMKTFSSLTKGVAKLGVKIAGSSGSITSLGSALGAVAGPVLAVVAIVATLAAAFKHLWDTNEEFRAAITGIWEGIKTKFEEFGQAITERLNALGFDFQNIVEVLKSIWDGFCSMLAPVFEAAFSLISTVLGTVLDVIVGILDVFIGLFTGNWSQMWNGITEIFSGIWNGITSVFSTVLEMLKEVADVFLGWFGTSWNEVWTGISTFFMNIWNGIVAFFTGIWESIKNVVSVGIQFIGAILEAAFDIITLPFRFIWENCKETITTVWETIKSIVSGAINAVSNVISTVMTAISTVISTVWTAISTKVSTVLNGIKTTVSTVFNTIKTVASTVWNGIKTTISTVVDGISSKVSSVFNSVKSIVSSVFNGIKSTATSVWNGIKSAITTPIEAAKNTIKASLDKISGFFSGLKLQLPHIKLPHFSISGSLSIAPPSVPHLSISWYKEGGILTRPTVFGMNGSSLMAGGEAGAEAVLPLSAFYKELENILTSRLNNDNVEKYLSIIAANSGKGIYLDDGTLVGRLLPAIDSGLGQNQKLNARLSL